MSRQIKIRRAVPSDARDIAHVHFDSWRSTYKGIVADAYLDALDYVDRERRWLETLEGRKPGRHVFVAEVDAQIVGFANVGKLREEVESFTGELYALYLLREYQRQGIGSLLLGTGMNKLVQLGHSNAVIWALTENPACRFYEAKGGVAIRRQPISIGEQTLEEVAYVWRDLNQFDSATLGSVP